MLHVGNIRDNFKKKKIFFIVKSIKGYCSQIYGKIEVSDKDKKNINIDN